MTTQTENAIGSATQTVGGYVTSITGTSNQITASASTGAVTLSTPSVGWKYAKASPTATAVKAMRATPIQLVAAGGANTFHIVNRFIIEHKHDATAYASGGVVFIQYDSTTAGGGVKATITTSANSLTGTTTCWANAASADIDRPTLTTVINKGLYVSNITGAFTTGTDTVIFHVFYTTISTTV
jgi:hypothetical protein